MLDLQLAGVGPQPNPRHHEGSELSEGRNPIIIIWEILLIVPYFSPNPHLLPTLGEGPDHGVDRTMALDEARIGWPARHEPIRGP